MLGANLGLLLYGEVSVMIYHTTSLIFVLLFLLLFFIWVLLPVKIISLILSRDNRKEGRKREFPREKKPDHPQAELDLSHMWPELGSNLQR